MNKVFSKKIVKTIVLIITIMICFSVITEQIFADEVSDTEGLYYTENDPLLEKVKERIKEAQIKLQQGESIEETTAEKSIIEETTAEKSIRESQEREMLKQVDKFYKEKIKIDFVPLAPIPGLIDKDTAKDPSKFFNALFTYGITIAGLLAVIMITVGGIQYMSSDAVSNKTEGRERITYALMGLLLVLFSWVLLYTINPEILNLTLFK